MSIKSTVSSVKTAATTITVVYAGIQSFRGLRDLTHEVRREYLPRKSDKK